MSTPQPGYGGPRLRLPKRRFRRIPVRTLVPNVITLLALCAGLTAIRMAFENRYVLALAAIVFAICAARRLARFNVMVDDPDKPAWASNFFVGVPAPAGAITVLLPIYMVLLGLPRCEWLRWLQPVYTLP